MDVIQMWQAIQNQDTTAHYQLLDGWRKSYELTLEHLGQVQNYRQNLAEAWPPEKSAASAAYLQRLDELIANLQSTYDAAVATHCRATTSRRSTPSTRRTRRNSRSSRTGHMSPPASPPCHRKSHRSRMGVRNS